MRWKLFWRTLRIARRVAWQVAEDAALYGTGAVYIGADGKPMRIDPASIILSPARGTNPNP